MFLFEKTVNSSHRILFITHHNISLYSHGSFPYMSALIKARFSLVPSHAASSIFNASPARKGSTQAAAAAASLEPVTAAYIAHPKM